MADRCIRIIPIPGYIIPHSTNHWLRTAHSLAVPPSMPSRCDSPYHTAGLAILQICSSRILDKFYYQKTWKHSALPSFRAIAQPQHGATAAWCHKGATAAVARDSLGVQNCNLQSCVAASSRNTSWLPGRPAAVLQPAHTALCSAGYIICMWHISAAWCGWRCTYLV
jgi:hypothetical protein